MYCTICGQPFTDETIEARDGIDKITEIAKDKTKRKTEAPCQRDTGRKRGESAL